MAINTYTKEINNITFIINSISSSQETEKVFIEKLKKLILNDVKQNKKAQAYRANDLIY